MWRAENLVCVYYVESMKIDPSCVKVSFVKESRKEKILSG